MNTRLTSIALALAALLGANGALAASTTHTLSVSATVNGNCKFNGAGPTPLVIANSGAVIDPAVGTDATGTANVAFRCTKGTLSAITADNGQNYSGSRRVAFGGEYMAYNLGLVGGAQTGTGFGSANDLTLTVNGTIPVAQFQNAAAGAYQDTVILTISP